jgi:hypothetical protein
LAFNAPNKVLGLIITVSVSSESKIPIRLITVLLFVSISICTAEEWLDMKEHIYFDFIKDNNFTELKDAELIKERLSLLAGVDPYTGRYFSQRWIQQNVLRLTDDEIKAMQDEIDEEKELGLGLPVGVTNDVAQQMMMSNVPQQPQNPADQEDE